MILAFVGSSTNCVIIKEVQVSWSLLRAEVSLHFRPEEDELMSEVTENESPHISVWVPKTRICASV